MLAHNKHKRGENSLQSEVGKLNKTIKKERSIFLGLAVAWPGRDPV